MTELVPSDALFKPGDLVTYRYGSRKVHAIVSCMSKTGQRVRIKFKWNPNASWDEVTYVMPKSLERGHV